MSTVLNLILLAFCLFLYFLPSVIAQSNGHKQTSAISALNLFLGWTLLGWVIALVWACIKENNSASNTIIKPTSTADEIKKLAELKEQGILTEDEFNAKKSQILGL